MQLFIRTLEERIVLCGDAFEVTFDSSSTLPEKLKEGISFQGLFFPSNEFDPSSAFKKNPFEPSRTDEINFYRFFYEKEKNQRANIPNLQEALTQGFLYEMLPFIKDAIDSSARAFTPLITDQSIIPYQNKFDVVWNIKPISVKLQLEHIVNNVLSYDTIVSIMSDTYRRYERPSHIENYHICRKDRTIVHTTLFVSIQFYKSYKMYAQEATYGAIGLFTAASFVYSMYYIDGILDNYYNSLSLDHYHMPSSSNTTRS